jgi:hypothetical protein
MKIRFWGALALFLGGLALLGGEAASGSSTVWAGGFVFCGGLVLTAIDVWKTLARKRWKWIDKEQAIAQLERLARLHEQGALTDKEFANQKRKVLAEQPEDESE